MSGFRAASVIVGITLIVAGAICADLWYGPSMLLGGLVLAGWPRVQRDYQRSIQVVDSGAAFRRSLDALADIHSSRSAIPQGATRERGNARGQRRGGREALGHSGARPAPSRSQ